MKGNNGYYLNFLKGATMITITIIAAIIVAIKKRLA